MPQKTKHPERSAVVYRLSGRCLLGIVSWVNVVAEGEPGPHRYRYAIWPARLVDGKPTRIESFRVKQGVRHHQLEAYVPEQHAELIDTWRVR